MKRFLQALCLCLLAVCSCGAGPADAVAAMALSLSQSIESDHEHYRFGYLPRTEEECDKFDAVVRYMANSISRGGLLKAPLRVAPDLWRFDLRDYKWRAETWELFADLDPYFHVKFERLINVGTRRNPAKRPKVVRAHSPLLKGTAIRQVAISCGTNVPMVRADWWLSRVCQQIDAADNADTGVGYFDWLEIKNRDDFFKLVRFRIKDSPELEFDQIDNTRKSGVAKNQRHIEKHNALSGAVYRTLDVKDGRNKGNSTRNLRRGDFKHDAEEWYMPNRNGLPVMLLCDKDGVRQNSAPEFVGFDKSVLNEGNDGRIHIFRSCNNCHAGNVLQPVDSWARKNFTVGRLALQVTADFAELDRGKQYQLNLDLQRQWLSNFKQPLDAQRFAYQAKIIEACGVTSEEIAKRLARAYHAYSDDQVDAAQAARELGATVEEMRAAFLRYLVAKGGMDIQLAGLFGGIELLPNGQIRFVPEAPEQTIPRPAWEELYPLAVRYMVGDLRDQNVAE